MKARINKYLDLLENWVALFTSLGFVVGANEFFHYLSRHQWEKGIALFAIIFVSGALLGIIFEWWWTKFPPKRRHSRTPLP
jgi:hypothetical protein